VKSHFFHRGRNKILLKQLLFFHILFSLTHSQHTV
jgi:hypothetical protein